jgi:hypothetical protein
MEGSTHNLEVSSIQLICFNIHISISEYHPFMTSARIIGFSIGYVATIGVCAHVSV